MCNRPDLESAIFKMCMISIIRSSVISKYMISLKNPERLSKISHWV